MKNVNILLLFLIFSSCTRETVRNTCFKFSNNTNYNISVEIYSSLNSSLDPVIIASNNSGVFYSECKNRFTRIPVTEFFQSDSIVVKFDNQRRFISHLPAGTFSFTGVLNEENYLREGDTFTYTFTQQDYDNATPF